ADVDTVRGNYHKRLPVLGAPSSEASGAGGSGFALFSAPSFTAGSQPADDWLSPFSSHTSRDSAKRRMKTAALTKLGEAVPVTPLLLNGLSRTTLAAAALGSAAAGQVLPGSGGSDFSSGSHLRAFEP
ncbi:MAG: hypothetical protein HYY24_13595, partial [Verrucomicrobia bacterium]|nr:hypothetical protein [Verrucomicrobiota bacterium]